MHNDFEYKDNNNNDDGMELKGTRRTANYKDKSSTSWTTTGRSDNFLFSKVFVIVWNNKFFWVFDKLQQKNFSHQENLQFLFRYHYYSFDWDIFTQQTKWKSDLVDNF